MRYVLVVEDNTLLRWCMKKCLEREGFCVVAPSTGEEALQVATTTPFDVLVTDWQLPNAHDGFKVFATVRESCPQIISILISAKADAQLAERALRTGFHRVIPKPFEVTEIVEALHTPWPSQRKVGY